MQKIKILLVMYIFLVMFSFGLVNAQMGNTMPENMMNQNKIEGRRNQDNDRNRSADENSIDNVAQKAGLNIFGAAVKISGLNQTLSIDGPYTVFASSDDAIRRLPDDIKRTLVTDDAKAMATLNNHVVKGMVTSRDVGNPNITNLINSTSIQITEQDGNVIVNGQKILQGVRYDNGVIYVIDGVILPPDL